MVGMRAEGFNSSRTLHKEMTYMGMPFNHCLNTKLTACLSLHIGNYNCCLPNSYFRSLRSIVSEIYCGVTPLPDRHNMNGPPSTYITVNYCFNIQNFDAFLAFFQIARLPHRYSGFLALAIPQLEPHDCLNIPV